MTNYTRLLDDIIRREGSKVTNIPGDRGGLTKYGVTQRAWNEYREGLRLAGRLLPPIVADISEEMAREFYEDEYIEPFAWVPTGDLLALLVDSAVNHGVTRATRWLQLAAGVEPDGIIGPATRKAVSECVETFGDYSHHRALYAEVLKTRFKFYAQIASDQLTLPGGDPDAKFLRGWINRACEFIR